MIVFIGDHSITKVLLLQPVCYLSVSAYLLTIYVINESECPISLGNYFCLLR